MQATVLFDGGASATLDTELTLTLPSAVRSGGRNGHVLLQIGVRCEAAEACQHGALLTLTLDGAEGSLSLKTAGTIGIANFALLPEEVAAAVLPIRIMTDYRSVEVFGAWGRAVCTAVLVSPHAFLTAEVTQGVVAVQATGWALKAAV